MKQAARTDWEFGNEQANAGNVDTWQSPGSGRNPDHSLPARGFNGTVVLRPNGRDDRDRNRGIGARHCRGLRVEPTQRLGDTKPLRSGPLDKLQSDPLNSPQRPSRITCSLGQSCAFSKSCPDCQAGAITEGHNRINALLVDNWLSSTSRPRRRLVSKCHRLCSAAPTR